MVFFKRVGMIYSGKIVSRCPPLAREPHRSEEAKGPLVAARPEKKQAVAEEPHVKARTARQNQTLPATYSRAASSEAGGETD